MIDLTLSDDQEDALTEILAFLANPDETEMALSGPAGTGKTVLTRYILQEARGGSKLKMWKLLFNTHNQLNVELTSSTNKAATILSDATGESAKTIHKLLGLVVKNDYSTGVSKVVKTKNTQIISNTLIIVDEASMINKQLLKIIRECTHECKVLYVGDAYQLAPVKENISPVFKEVKNQVKLTQIQRQVAGSPIIQFAGGFRTALDTEQFPVVASSGAEVIHLSDQDFQKEIDNQFPHIADMSHKAKIICWTNARVHQYNNYVRNLQGLGSDYQVGEWLITNEAIMIGETRKFKGDEIVKITDMEPYTKYSVDGWNVTLDGTYIGFQAKDMSHVKQLMKHFAKQKDWHSYFMVKEEFIDLRPYFSSTIAKSQGSTYENVFIDVADIGRNTKKSEIARLMYTAITRASQKVYMRGDLPTRLY